MVGNKVMDKDNDLPCKQVICILQDLSPDSSVGKESACNAGDPSLIPGLGRSPGEGIGYPPVFLGFPYGSAGKESACNVEDLGSIPGLGRSPGEGKGYPLQYLAWRIPCTVQSMGSQGVRHDLSDFHSTPLRT